MNALSSQLALVAGAAAAVALNALWEDALLVFCVWLLLRAWPRLNAATRYAVWTATLVAAVIVPVATTLPFVGASASPVHTSSGRSTALASARSAHDDKAVAERSTVPSQVEGAAAASLPPAALPERLRLTLPLPVAMTLLVAWTLFALVSHARLATALLKLEALKRDALPLPIEYREAMVRWNAANKGSRDVRLCVSDDIDVPVAVGLFDSMILIPRALLDRLSPNEIDQICLHELAHLRRADDWSNGVQRIALALFAWNPAALFVGRQLDLEREVACDDWVLSSTELVRPYALCLTKMAETATWPYRPMAAPGVFASRKHLSLRVERLLAAGRNAATNLSVGPATAAVAVVVGLSGAMLLVAPSVAASVSVHPIAAMHPVQAVNAPLHEAHVMHRVAPSVVQRQVAVVTVPVAGSAAVSARRIVAQTAPAQPRPTASPKTIHVNGSHVHLPARTIKVPAVDVDVPAIDVKVPTAAVAVPNLSQTIENSVKAATAAASAATASAGAMRLAQGNGDRACNGCNFSGVNWSGRNLRDVAYLGVDLSGAKLSRTDFAGGRFNGVNFKAADLSGANFSGAKLVGVDFTNANLDGANFNGAVLTGCDFKGVDLSRVDLSKAQVIGSDMPGQSQP